MSDESKMRDAADAIRGAVEAVPVYNDLAQPAFREVGTALAGMVRVALAPVSALVWGYDRIAEWLPEAIARRIRNVAPNEIRTPPPEIAGPALESLRYTAQREELREMYASLLATAMDPSSATSAHPSFVEIIRQLTPDEARVVSAFTSRTFFAVMAMLPLHALDTETPRYCNFAAVAGGDPSHIDTVYLDNLRRLGLIQISNGVYFGNQDADAGEEFVRLIQERFGPILDEHGRNQYAIRRLPITITSFGRLFALACVRPVDDSATMP